MDKRAASSSRQANTESVGVRQDNLSRREALEAQARANMTEKVDPTPVEVPPFYSRPPTMKEEIQRYVRFEVSRAAGSAGFETFEEANDLEFEDDDDLELVDSEYQLTRLQEENTMGYDNEEGESDESERGRRESAEARRGNDESIEGHRETSGSGELVDGLPRREDAS